MADEGEAGVESPLRLDQMEGMLDTSEVRVVVDDRERRDPSADDRELERRAGDKCFVASLEPLRVMDQDLESLTIGIGCGDDQYADDLYRTAR